MRWSETPKPMILIEEDTLAIRDMEDTEEEYQRMYTWLLKPEVKEWYFDEDAQTYEAVREKYDMQSLKDEYVTSTIIEYEGKPIGYLQFYETQNEKEYPYSVPLLEEPGVWGIDLFIGETDFIGKGIGPKVIAMIIEYLKKEKHVRTIIIDPDIKNERAIKAYEKAGFQKVQVLKNWETHLGVAHDAWLMTYKC